MIVSADRYEAWKTHLSQIDVELQRAMTARQHERVTAESADLIIFSQRLRQLWYDLDRLEKRAKREETASVA